jgi:CO/xanthine dehydrogenase FAD-binding subunit
MKPVPFTYRRAASVAEACAWRAEDPQAVLIAGGQSLMPMLAMRLVRPSQVIDIGRIPELDAIRVETDHVFIGATTRQETAEQSPIIAEEVPLLARALPWIGHPPTRRRGTIGGSIANADPAAEIALIAVTLGAEIMIAGAADGRASLPAAEFFLAPMVTALPEGAMVTGLRLPRMPRPRTGSGFAEIARRHGDFALAAAAAMLSLDSAGAIAGIAVAIGGATPVPTKLALDRLIGLRPEDQQVAPAIAQALAPLDMMTDLHASAPYRRRAAERLAGTVIAMAAAEAAAR